LLVGREQAAIGKKAEQGARKRGRGKTQPYIREGGGTVRHTWDTPWILKGEHRETKEQVDGPRRHVSDSGSVRKKGSRSME